MALSVVYPPPGSPVAPAVDIVAVHGLGGDAFDTWTSPHSKAFWLKDFLPQQIPDARILTFGYNATAAFGDSTSTVVDHAKSLLASLVDKREDDGEQSRPLIFVVHSLGGIVVKQALLSARLELRYQTICDATIGVVFFGTPHRGSEQANYAKVLVKIAQTMVHKPTRTLVKSLQANCQDLQQLTTDFRHQLPRYKIVSFYEQRPMKPFRSLIVEKHSALLEVENEEQLPVDANHSAMCKFERQEEDTYEKAWKRIQRMREVSQVDVNRDAGDSAPGPAARNVSDRRGSACRRNSSKRYLLPSEARESRDTSTIDMACNFADSLWDQGKLEEAKQMYEQVLARYEEALGPDHSSTLYAVAHLGILNMNLGKLDEAEKLFKRALAWNERTLGRDDTSTLDIAWNLGLLYIEQGRLIEAEQLNKRALAGYERALGPDHTSTLYIVWNLGDLYVEMGKSSEAEQMYKRALAGYEKAEGPDSTSARDISRSLHDLYVEQGKPDEAA